MNNIKIDRPEQRRTEMVTPVNTPSNDDPDLDNDGKLSNKEFQIYERRAANRRKMAWLSLISLIASGFALMFIVPDNRLSQLNGLLELYWIALGGVVGAYVGISAWTKRG